jgi:hypothetical protein
MGIQTPAIRLSKKYDIYVSKLEFIVRVYNRVASGGHIAVIIYAYHKTNRISLLGEPKQI